MSVPRSVAGEKEGRRRTHLPIVNRSVSSAATHTRQEGNGKEFRAARVTLHDAHGLTHSPCTVRGRSKGAPRNLQDGERRRAARADPESAACTASTSSERSRASAASTRKSTEPQRAPPLRDRLVHQERCLRRHGWRAPPSHCSTSQKGIGIMQNMKRVLGAATLRWLDQTITSFALIASFAGGNLSGLRLLLVLGLGNLLGDAVSMALGDFTSERSEQQFLLSEYASEAWEVDNHFPGEVNEMRHLYRQAGLSDDDADALVNILAKYPKTVFLDTMFTQELGLIPPAESQKPLITNNTHDEHQHHQSHASASTRDSSDAPAWKKALVTLTSFLLFGSVPLIAYIPMWAFIQSQLAFVLTIPIEAVTLFVLGVLKSVSARQKWWRGGAEVLLVGGIAASIAFATGYGIEMALPSSWSS